jgi:superfamily II DNA/RNA helicase
MNRPIHIRASDPDEGLMQANIEHLVYRAHNMDKDEVIGRILMAEGRGKTIIFTRTKRAAAKLVEELGDRGFNATAVHGDLNQEQRERSMASFKSGKKEILIATDVAARGIDVDDVTHVINHTIPEDEKAYLHRVGRTGRAGKTGIAVTFVDWDDLHKWSLINKALDFGQPEPMETYSSSPHLYVDLNIPAGSKGRLRATPVKDVAAGDVRNGGAGRSGGARSGTGNRSESGRSGAARSGRTEGRSEGRSEGGRGAARGDSSRGSDRPATSPTTGADAPSRSTRSRTRVGSSTNPEAPAATPAAGTHDGGGAEHHDGNNAPLRRSRTRRRSPQSGS